MCITVVCYVFLCECFFFFKQKTAYELRISDWSSDVCSSDLHALPAPLGQPLFGQEVGALLHRLFGLAAKAQVAQARAAADQLLVEPGGPDHARSEARRVGKECGSTGRSRWEPCH